VYRLEELLERLARNYGCEIHLYSQRVEDLPFLPPTSASQNKSGSIIWHKVPFLPGPHIVQFLFWFYANRFYRWFHRAFRGLSFDLVLSPGINCADADAVIVHVLFHRLYEISREVPNPSLAKPSLFRKLHRNLYYALLTRLEKRVYSNPSVTLAAVSPRTAALLGSHFYRQDVAVIPNGVDTSYFSPSARLSRREAARSHWGFQDGEMVLLLIGNDWANKGLPTILQALKELSDTPAKLLIVGSDLISPWRELAQRMGVLDRCVWEATCTDILDAYAAADVYVSPSREDSFGMPVAEAMACGLPVITSTYAGISFLLQDSLDSFILPDPCDAKTLAELIRRLFEQNDLRARMGQAAADASREWTWDRNATAVFQILMNVSDNP
jgi:glycosyltransferase involved in cell wall biosynthesis